MDKFFNPMYFWIVGIISMSSTIVPITESHDSYQNQIRQMWLNLYGFGESETTHYFLITNTDPTLRLDSGDNSFQYMSSSTLTLSYKVAISLRLSLERMM